MGLAEPRKRLKLSHDPNNLAWSTSSSSYGQRLMLSQGWKAGEGLGAANHRGFNSYDNSQLKVSFKDDTLGLGASLKSKDIEHSRTGLDAFQGLLGRLNGKSDTEVQEAEKKVEDRKLAMFAQGNFGGMVFVPGGLLVQRNDFKMNDETTEAQREFKALRNDAEAIAKAKGKKKKAVDVEDEMVPVDPIAKARRKQEKLEKRQRKEERRRRKAEKGRTPESTTPTASSPRSLPAPPEEESGYSTEVNDMGEGVAVAARPRPTARNGRQVLRSRNIAAKRLAFADPRMLDEIFMRKV